MWTVFIVQTAFQTAFQKYSTVQKQLLDAKNIYYFIFWEA
jgi:hypothetical protein